MRSLTTRQLVGMTFLAVALAVPQCYYPDGSESTDVACNIDIGTRASHCCGLDNFCLGNGLCYKNGVISRESCTDKTFSDPACPRYCTLVNTNMAIAILSCDVNNKTFFCSEYDDLSCSDSGTEFFMPDANTFLFNNSANQMVTLAPYAVLNASIAVSGASHANGTSRTVTATVTASDQASASATTHSEARFTAGDMAGVGAGIGVPLLLALPGTMYMVIRQRKLLSGAARQGFEPKVSASGYVQPEIAGQSSHHVEMDQQNQLSELGEDRKTQELGTSR